jgi:hypothetical protein
MARFPVRTRHPAYMGDSKLHSTVARAKGLSVGRSSTDWSLAEPGGS